jgi:hypothetical protein
MGTRKGILGAWLVAASLASTAVWSSPILDDYFVAGVNFPVNFGPSAALTFNASGDLSTEFVPTSEIGVNRLEVFEEVVGLSPTGAEVLRFHFNFLSSPNLDAGFSFTISGLEWDAPGHGELEQSFINVMFGTGETGVQEATLATTWMAEADGLSVTFATPAGSTWNTIFGGLTPTSLMVDFFETVQHVPEPSTLLLLGGGALIGVFSRRK